MSYGNVKEGGVDLGYQQKPPRKTDVYEDKEAAGDPQPPASTVSPPANPPKQEVDPAYVAQLAIDSLPSNDAFLDFVQWSRGELAEMTKAALDGSGVNPVDFNREMQGWLDAIQATEKELNKKQEDTTPGGQPVEWPPLPGASPDEQCRSIFDANDLALRGRKSVLVKRFYVPLIFPQLLLDPNQQWAFGQKVEYLQEWRHEGFTLGELISTLSLLPNEELTIEVSSWQRTRTEIENVTEQDKKDKYEREQSRTDEESVVNEAASTSGWSVSATGSVSYGPASASTSANLSGSVSERSEQAERHISEATSKATNEISLRRAVKMTQTAEAGSENRTTRRIRNPNTCHTVTFNFFQIVKLYDVQLRLENDAPVIMLPGLFPAYYDNGAPVIIPYWTIESFVSPAVFLTQFFEVDRDISQEIHGFALRVRIDPARSPQTTLTQLAQALLVAIRYLLKLDVGANIQVVSDMIRNYTDSTRDLRKRTKDRYGKDKGRSEQVTTPGIYADSLLGRCTACEEYVEASRYVDVMTLDEERKRVAQQNSLTEVEAARRSRLLEKDKLDPFGAPCP